MMNDKAFFVVLPKSIILAKGWRKGDILKVDIDQKGKLILDKKVS